MATRAKPKPQRNVVLGNAYRRVIRRGEAILPKRRPKPKPLPYP